MPDLSPIANELERLADVAYAAGQHWRQVTDRRGPEEQAAIAALQDRLVEAGVSQRHAEWAVTRWLITRRPVLECVAATDENGPVNP